MGFPVHGAGLGLRRRLLPDLVSIGPEAVDFLELAPENWIGVGGRFGRQFRLLAEKFPLVCHGLSLSIGGPAPLDEAFVKQVKAFLDHHNVLAYNEHLSYCGDERGHLYDLMPIPFTDEAVRHVAARIRRVQDILERRIGVENISYYAAPGRELTELEFVNAVLREADCDLLLDVNNICVNSINFGYDAKAFLAGVDASRVQYIHLAGHFEEAPDLRIDTHGAPVVEPVWNLLGTAFDRYGEIPVLLERDFNFPPFRELLDEVGRIRSMQAAVASAKASSPWQKSGEAPRGARGEGEGMRLPGKTRRARISGTFERRAEPSARGARGGTPRTKMQSGGIQRRSNVGGLLPRAASPRFIEVQRAFAGHIRNPELSPAPADVAPRRMQVYVRLFHRNIESFLSNGFPVAKSVLHEARWRDLVQGFIHRHASETPYFMDIGQEFMTFLDSDPSLDRPDWLLELCHFEWVTRSLKHAGEEIPEAGIDPNGDLLTGQIVPSPLVRSLCYRYRVDEIAPQRLPREPPEKPVWLIICRRRNDRVSVLRSNALTHRLLQIVRGEADDGEVPASVANAEVSLAEKFSQTTGEDALADLAVEFPQIKAQRLHQQGAATLQRLREAEVILGVRVD